MGTSVSPCLQGVHFPKGRAEALTTAGMLSIRGQEGATMDAGDGSAAGPYTRQLISST